jgi:hypothetical protein
VCLVAAVLAITIRKDPRPGAAQPQPVPA